MKTYPEFTAKITDNMLTIVINVKDFSGDVMPRDFEVGVQECINEHDAQKIIFDMSKVKRLGALFIGLAMALMNQLKKEQRELYLINCNDDVSGYFSATNLAVFFNISSSERLVKVKPIPEPEPTAQEIIDQLVLDFWDELPPKQPITQIDIEHIAQKFMADHNKQSPEISQVYIMVVAGFNQIKLRQYGFKIINGLLCISKP